MNPCGGVLGRGAGGYVMAPQLPGGDKYQMRCETGYSFSCCWWLAAWQVTSGLCTKTDALCSHGCETSLWAFKQVVHLVTVKHSQVSQAKTYHSGMQLNYSLPSESPTLSHCCFQRVFTLKSLFFSCVSISARSRSTSTLQDFAQNFQASCSGFHIFYSCGKAKLSLVGSFPFPASPCSVWEGDEVWMEKGRPTEGTWNGVGSLFQLVTEGGTWY